jgi:hypothetical protein
MLLLKVKLTKDNAQFGTAGQYVLISANYVVGISPNGTGSKITVRMGDGNLSILEVKELFDTNWKIVTLNP